MTKLAHYLLTTDIIAEPFDGSVKQAKRWGLKQLDKGTNDWYISFEQIDPLKIGDYLVNEDGNIYYVSKDYFESHYKKNEKEEN